MKNYFIALILLVFELSGSFEHSIVKDDTMDSMDRQHTSVYAVQEDPESNSIKFIHPWSDRPTLREIVYYHVIEKAYDEEMADTERPFTNAHGQPFFEENTLDQNDNDEVSKDTELEPEMLTDNITETYERVGPYSNTDKVVDDEVLTAEVTTRKPEEETKQTERKPRAQIFNEIKDKYRKKYENTNDEQTVDHARSKRDMRKQGIPEAPAIPRIRYDSFPDYLRQLISTERPEVHKDNAKININNDKVKSQIKTSHEKVMDKKMEDMEDILQSFKEANLSEEKEANVSPRTYGMNLNDKGGYVWNDIFTNPGISYEVGNLGTLHENVVDEKENISTADGNTSEESLDTIEGHSENDSHDDELDDIFVHSSKPKVNTPSTSGDYIDDEDETMAADKASNEATEHDDEYQSIAEELLESDEFWEWVLNWTEIIIDVLKKFTKETVQAEVKKQLKTHRERSKPGNKEDTLLVPQKDFEDATDDNISDKTNNFEIKDNKLIIDGTEIPLIDILNFITGKGREDEENIQNDNQLRSRKNKKKKPSSSNEDNVKIEDKNKTEVNQNKPLEADSSKNQTGFAVEIKNVYGNAVGSDKVTNVFIFYPDKGIDKVIQELKPMVDENGTFIIKPATEKEQEKNDEKQDIPLEMEKENTESELEQKKTESKAESTESSLNPETEKTTSKSEEPKESESDKPDSEADTETSTDSEKPEKYDEEKDDNEKETVSQSTTDTPSTQDQARDDKERGDTTTSQPDDKEVDLNKTEV